MKASKGIIKTVTSHIWLHELTLEDAQKINSLYGWEVKGIPKKIHLSDEDLMIAHNQYLKQPLKPSTHPKALYTTSGNAIFMVLAFILSMFFFDEKMPVKGTFSYICGSLLFLAGLYLLSNIVSIRRAQNQLTTKSTRTENTSALN